MPIHYSRVNLLDPVDKGRTRVRSRYLPTGERLRVAVRSGTVIPRVQVERPERPAPRPSPQCTSALDAAEETYVPHRLLARRQAAAGQLEPEASPNA